jgi:import inner membrane translocase subunit TIM10
MVTDVFNRLVSSCHAKCISTRYAEPDLNKGESICIDR